MVRKKSTVKRSNKGWWILIGILAAILLVVTILTREPIDPIRIDPTDPQIGDADAPITVVVFGDYDCSYTRQFYQEIYPSLTQRIASGNLRLVVKSFPISGPVASTAARGTLCAGDQGHFWEYQEGLLTRDHSTEGSLVAIAGELGLDLPLFQTCLDEGKHQGRIEETLRYGTEELGIDATPTIYVNGLKIAGTPSPEAFESVLKKFRS